MVTSGCVPNVEGQKGLWDAGWGILPAELLRMKEMITKKGCTAFIFHGPGHQSKTRCHNTKKGHHIHETHYGSYRQYARWTGQKVYSGFFDEPPQDNK